MDAGQPGEPSAVPRHKILQTAFRLKSKKLVTANLVLEQGRFWTPSPRGRGAVAGRSWWSWKIGEAWLPKVLYRLLGNTLPRFSMTAHVRATPALSNLAPHEGVHDRGTLCQVGPGPKQKPAPCCLLPRHFAMTWSDSDTKVGHLSPLEACKAFAFHVALEAISTKLKVPAYELLGKRSQAWIAEQLTIQGGGCPS